MLRHCLFLSFVLAYLLPLAQTDTLSSYKMGLDDLAEIEDFTAIKVTTASKTAENISDAPSVITVISRKEIDAYGANTLHELLDRLVSSWTYGTGNTPFSTYSIRGDMTINDNTHVLVLIDGRPTREVIRSGQYTAFYGAFTTDRIERIEIIRGPGSVLYGTGAFMGAINIITKTGSQQKLTASLKAGAYNYKQVQVAGGKQFGDLEISGGLNYMKDDGFIFNAADENDTIRKVPYGRSGYGMDVKMVFKKNLTLHSYYGTYSQVALGRAPIWTDGFRNDCPRLFTDLGYEKSILPWWKVTANFTYNHFKYDTYKIGVGSEKFDESNFSSYLGEVTNYFKPNENSNIIFGASVNNFNGVFLFYDRTSNASAYDISKGTNMDPYYFIPPFASTWTSIYTQADYKIIDKIKFVAGGQFNHTEKANNFVPRAAIVANIYNGFGAKAMYGQAFRSPMGIETTAGSRDPTGQGDKIIRGDPNLNPELNSTIEAQLFYVGKKAEVYVTGFQVENTSLITRSTTKDTTYVNGVASTTPTFINLGSIKYQGVELEAKAYLKKNLFFNVAVSYQQNADNLNRKNYTGASNLIAKAGVSYKHPKGLGVGLFNSYMGKPGDIVSNPNKKFNREVTAFNYASLNLDLDLQKLTDNGDTPPIFMSLYCTNLFNEPIYYAEYARRNLNSLPGRAGRCVYGSISLRF